MANTTVQSVQVHRYCDHVAIYLGGETKYLLPGDAQELVNAINRVITDIAEWPFAKSQVGTFHATFRVDRYNEGL